jgi:peptidoglycan/xylan/chitin deacetylase (PgdA/CDA1 family)
MRPQFFVLLAAVGVLTLGAVWPALTQRSSVSHDVPGHFASSRHAGVSPLPVRPVRPPVDCSVHACLALTFDDGPHAAVTPQILNILQRHQVHATFFVIGSHAHGNEQLLRRMYLEGHEIGNHTWDHPDLTTLTVEQVEMQVARTQAAVTAAGVPAPTLFRPPYGAVNNVVQAHVPLTFALWNVDPEDWRQETAKDVIDHVMPNVGAGRVVDLHDIHQPTADALDQLLNELSPHYQFVTFSELFAVGAGQRGVYYGR